VEPFFSSKVDFYGIGLLSGQKTGGSFSLLFCQKYVNPEVCRLWLLFI